MGVSDGNGVIGRRVSLGAMVVASMRREDKAWRWGAEGERDSKLLQCIRYVNIPSIFTIGSYSVWCTIFNQMHCSTRFFFGHQECYYLNITLEQQSRPTPYHHTCYKTLWIFLINFLFYLFPTPPI